MLWGGRWEGGSCLGTHVRIKDFKIQNIKKFKKKFPLKKKIKENLKLCLSVARAVSKCSMAVCGYCLLCWIAHITVKKDKNVFIVAGSPGGQHSLGLL